MIGLLATALVVSSSGTASSWTPSRGPWIADAGTGFLEIRWAPAEGALVLDTGGAWSMTTDAVAVDGIARARVEGLRAGVAYRYRASSGAHSTPVATARTLPAPGSATSFAVFGDTRTNDTPHARVASAIAATNPDFVVNTGDLVDNGTVEANWSRFFEAERSLLAGALLLPAAGNHDERGLLNDSTMQRYFPRPPFYEVTAGVVRLLFVDSNRAYGPGSEQGAWILQRLDAAATDRRAGRIRWIAVVHHHPAFSSSGHGSDPAVRRDLVPLYEQFGVDVVFNGHDHDFERLESNGVTYYVTGGGGAPLYDMVAMLPESRVHAVTHHYLRVDASEKSFDVTAIDTDGNVLDRASLDATRPRPGPVSAAADGEARRIAGGLAAVLLAGAVAWIWSARFS